MLVLSESVDHVANASAFISVASTSPPANPQILLAERIQRINASSFQVLLNGPLQLEGHQYTVSIAPNAFYDRAEPPRFSGAFSFQFTTVPDAFAPAVQLDAGWPTPGSVFFESSASLLGIKIRFDEPVRQNPNFTPLASAVFIYDTDDGTRTPVSSPVVSTSVTGMACTGEDCCYL